MKKTPPINRSDYKVFYPLETRWMDNDIYGHVNNVHYYSYFDTAVNRYLINEGGLDIAHAPIVGFVVHSNCNYLSSITYPDLLEIGLRVSKLGNSSVTYQVGIFKKDADTTSAYGEFVHVFVERAKHQSVPIPDQIRQALAAILI